jgi:hypothetical protein
VNIKYVLLLLSTLVFLFLSSVTEAARLYTITQNPALGTAFDMGTTQTITYTIANTSTGGNVGERIYEARFRIDTGSTFSSSTAAPAGWTRTAFSPTSVTFRATSWANSIITGSSLDFNLNMNMFTTTADINEILRDVRVSYTLDTNFADGIARTGRVTTNNVGSWTLKSLLITSFQILDATCSTPTGSIVSELNFCLRMTVQNISSATLNSIITSANPPAASKTGTVTQGLVSTTYNPNPLNLTAGSSGTISFVYSTAGTDNGTIYFTASARNNTNSATSRAAISATLVVSRLNISISVRGPIVANPDCIFSGDTATFIMTVTNNTGSTVTNIVPQALTRFGTAAIGTFIGPSPASIASLANGASGTFTWTAPITGTMLSGSKRTLWVTGFVTRDPGAAQSVIATSNTQDLDGYTLTVSPDRTNASSTNKEFTWTLENYGCANTRSVSISYPGSWTFGGDSYSLIGGTEETWTASGASPVLFSSGSQIPILGSGDFSLVFSRVPLTTGTDTFNITIADANATPIVKVVPTSITVDPYNTGGANNTSTGVWREQY